MILFIPGGFEWLLIVLVIVLLFFGGRKIPELMRGIGKGMGELDKARKEKNEEPEKKD